MLPMSIADNLLAASYDRVSAGPFIDRAKATKAVEDAIAQLSIKLNKPTDAVATLSGGNQQKVVIAKWLMTDPEVILLNDPTRGIDVGTKQELYRLMRELADRGNGDPLLFDRLRRADRLLRPRRGHVRRPHRHRARRQRHHRGGADLRGAQHHRAHREPAREAQPA